MNISGEFFPSDGSNSSENTNNVEVNLAKVSSDIIILLSVFPINVYVIWLIATGAGNGLAAEFFSLNLSVCENLFCLESLSNLLMNENPEIWMVASAFDALAITGRPVFQCLLCVERYLAVIHPVMFLKFKPLRYRIFCCVVAWISCFVSSGLFMVIMVFALVVKIYLFFVSHLCVFFFVQLFCLVAVLRALKQSGPGDRKKEEENQMKRRAFYLILITALFTLATYVFYIVVMCLASDAFYYIITAVCSLLFALSGLVQPLFFLHRVKKIPFCKK